MYGSCESPTSTEPMLNPRWGGALGILAPSRAEAGCVNYDLHCDQDDPNVFPCVIGRSFYESVLPQQSVSLGWSSYAAMWLSHIPSTIPGHFQARHTELG